MPRSYQYCFVIMMSFDWRIIMAHGVITGLLKSGTENRAGHFYQANIRKPSIAPISPLEHRITRFLALISLHIIIWHYQLLQLQFLRKQSAKHYSKTLTSSTIPRRRSGGSAQVTTRLVWGRSQRSQPIRGRRAHTPRHLATTFLSTAFSLARGYHIYRTR